MTCTVSLVVVVWNEINGIECWAERCVDCVELNAERDQATRFVVSRRGRARRRVDNRTARIANRGGTRALG
jgi:hypothetical protein